MTHLGLQVFHVVGEDLPQRLKFTVRIRVTLLSESHTDYVWLPLLRAGRHLRHGGR